jgi:hypothetical protein
MKLHSTYLAITLSLPFAQGFTHNLAQTSSSTKTSQLLAAREEEQESGARRSFMSSIGMITSTMLLAPENAVAGIDVSGLSTEGGPSGNPSLATQLKAYDGSGSARVREIKSIQADTVTSTIPKIGTTLQDEAEAKVGHWAYRANPGFSASLSRAGTFGNLYRYKDQLAPPSGSKKRSIGVQFDFPNDWLQLDKYTGGIQYVDQRNGDKLYVLQAALPQDTSLETLSKGIIGDLIFDPQGSVVKTSQTVEDYKVASAQVLTSCPDESCSTRRRFKIKYATVTGNGLRVERRALVDAYQVENDIYMLMTSSNAVKFEQKDSRERETVENIVSSFLLDV